MPNSSRKPLSPPAEIFSARELRMRATQPSSRQRPASAAPSAPARCSRRSLQSTQGAAERAAAALDVLEMDAEVGEELLAGVRDHAAVFAKHDVFVPGQRVRQSDAKPAGNMVVASARGA